MTGADEAGAGVLLEYSYRLFQPFPIDEALSVYDDGGIWLWSLQPAEDEHKDRAGTFAFRVPGDELEAISELAAEVVDSTDEPGATQQPGAVEAVLKAHSEGRERTVLLSAAAELPDELERARQLGLALTARAQSAPLGIVKLSWRPLDPNLRVDAPSTLMFTCENPGVRAVDVLFRSETFAIYAQAEFGWDEWWHSEERGTAGLVDSQSGALLGGVLSPATLEPGASATAVFVNAVTPRRSGRVELGAAVDGRVTMLRPGGPEDFPGGVFRLQTPPAAFEIA